MFLSHTPSLSSLPFLLLAFQGLFFVLFKTGRTVYDITIVIVPTPAGASSTTSLAIAIVIISTVPARADFTVVVTIATGTGFQQHHRQCVHSSLPDEFFAAGINATQAVEQRRPRRCHCRCSSFPYFPILLQLLLLPLVFISLVRMHQRSHENSGNGGILDVLRSVVSDAILHSCGSWGSFVSARLLPVGVSEIDDFFVR